MNHNGNDIGTRLWAAADQHGHCVAATEAVR